MKPRAQSEPVTDDRFTMLCHRGQDASWNPQCHVLPVIKFQCAMTHKVVFFAESLKCLSRSGLRVEPVRRQAHWLGITYSHQIAVNAYKPAGYFGDPANPARTSLVVPFGTFLQSEHMLHREIGAAGIVGESQRNLWH